ncbi:acetyltransferase [Sinomonas sp. R1AF57]|uniref:acetyltransferase n=1 Tax=Sinomonas sp. R1AF57 TaxID=2020377 RepID=UPI000B605FC4|nr:acetyltransferase [Sinomonas sp. R1AF57]ASN51478.1 acetyltransferase [Sinomonas sp. R1AF57]
MSELLMVGASGLAREVMASVRSGSDFDILGLLDDDPAKEAAEIDGAHVLGSLEAVTRFPLARVVLCVGAGTGRERLARRLAGLGLGHDRYATIIDSSARVPEGCHVGAGSILLAHVTLTAAVRLGRHVVVMPHVTLTHEDDVDDFVTLAAGASLGGGVRVGRCAYLGMNSSVRQQVVVGDNAVVGMGAAVLDDVPRGEVWAGVPARQLSVSGAGSNGSLGREAS